MHLTYQSNRGWTCLCPGGEKWAGLGWGRHAFGRSFHTPGWPTYRHVPIGRETALQGLGVREGARYWEYKRVPTLDWFPAHRRCWSWYRLFWLRRRGSVKLVWSCWGRTHHFRRSFPLDDSLIVFHIVQCLFHFWSTLLIDDDNH